MIQCFTFTQPIANINKKWYKDRNSKKNRLDTYNNK